MNGNPRQHKGFRYKCRKCGMICIHPEDSDMAKQQMCSIHVENKND